jgi:Kef-type K+ transport system membrane component KefB
MPAWLILGMVGGLLVVAFLANRVFRLTRIPDVVVLMGLGLLLGPVLGLVNVEKLSRATSLLGTLAIILVRSWRPFANIPCSWQLFWPRFSWRAGWR